MFISLLLRSSESESRGEEAAAGESAALTTKEGHGEQIPGYLDAPQMKVVYEQVLSELGGRSAR